jgi:hypothetical protein
VADLENQGPSPRGSRPGRKRVTSGTAYRPRPESALCTPVTASTTTGVDPDAWSRVLARREFSWVLADRDLGPLRLDPPQGLRPTTSMYARLPLCVLPRHARGSTPKSTSLSQLSELAGTAELCNGVCAP